MIEIRVNSFAAFLPENTNSRKAVTEERMATLLAEMETADSIGLDAFGIGEHHRSGFLGSARAIILEAAVGIRNIRLNSALTMLCAAAWR